MIIDLDDDAVSLTSLESALGSSGGILTRVSENRALGEVYGGFASVEGTNPCVGFYN